MDATAHPVGLAGSLRTGWIRPLDLPRSKTPNPFPVPTRQDQASPGTTKAARPQPERPAQWIRHLDLKLPICIMLRPLVSRESS